MNQQKIGEFLKHLRKNKGLTQEQLAEHFYVSSRTVSRWETGKNIPDVDMLIDLADFYEIDISEIIDGEIKSENMNNQTKSTLKKVAKYATEESNKKKENIRTMLTCSACLIIISYMLFGSEHKGRLNGIIPETICNNIMWFIFGFAIVTFILYTMWRLNTFEKITRWKKKRKKQL